MAEFILKGFQEGYKWTDLWSIDPRGYDQKYIYLYNNFREVCMEKGVNAVTNLMDDLLNGRGDKMDAIWDDYWDTVDFSRKSMADKEDSTWGNEKVSGDESKCECEDNATTFCQHCLDIIATPGFWEDYYKIVGSSCKLNEYDKGDISEIDELEYDYLDINEVDWKDNEGEDETKCECVEKEINLCQHCLDIIATSEIWEDDYKIFGSSCMSDNHKEEEIGRIDVLGHDYWSINNVNCEANESNLEDKEILSQECQNILSKPLLYQLEYSGEGMDELNNMQSKPENLSTPLSNQNNLTQLTNSHLDICLSELPLKPTTQQHDIIPTNFNSAILLESKVEKTCIFNTKFPSCIPQLSELKLKEHKSREDVTSGLNPSHKPFIKKMKWFTKKVMPRFYKGENRRQYMALNQSKTNRECLLSRKQHITEVSRSNIRQQSYSFNPNKNIKAYNSFRSSYIAPNWQRKLLIHFIIWYRKQPQFTMDYSLVNHKLISAVAIRSEKGQIDTGPYERVGYYKGPVIVEEKTCISQGIINNTLYS